MGGVDITVPTGMRLRQLKTARLELEEAIHYYNGMSPGLGFDFLDEVDRTVRLITSQEEHNVMVEVIEQLRGGFTKILKILRYVFEHLQTHLLQVRKILRCKGECLSDDQEQALRELL